jgi:hypothetical protein
MCPQFSLTPPPLHTHMQSPRRGVEDRIHLSYGTALFHAGEYEQAMLHFGMSSLAGPLELVSLFPSFAPRRLLEPLLQARQRDAAAGEAGAHASGDGSSLNGGSSDDTEGVGAGVGAGGSKEAPKLEGEQYRQAVAAVLPYLLSQRSRLAVSAAAALPHRSSSDFLTSSLQQQGGGGGSKPDASKMDRVGSSGRDADADAKGGVVASKRLPHMASSSGLLSAAAQAKLQSDPSAVLIDTALLHALLVMPDTGALLRWAISAFVWEGGGGEGGSLRGSVDGAWFPQAAALANTNQPTSQPASMHACMHVMWPFTPLRVQVCAASKLCGLGGW